MFGRKKDSEERNERKGGGFLGFVAFLVTIFAAVLYLVALILQFIEVNVPQVIETMRLVASTITICIVGILGWRFVKYRAKWCKLLYVLLILAVVACVIVPIVLQYIP